MFFKKKVTAEPRLIDVVNKKADTGYVFWNITDDLGHSVDNIQASTPMVLMAYAYARRSAAAALYVQGICNKDIFNHVQAVFKSLQLKTGQTVEFQKQAAAQSSEFLQSYHYAITTFFEKKVTQIAIEYDVSGDRLSDGELFEEVIETAHQELKNSLT